MCFAAGVEVVHMARARQFRELDSVPSRLGGSCVIARDFNWQSLVCGTVNDELF
jgi:hypothetical protein